MIQKTTNYSMFKLKKDNREKGIDNTHVQKLIDSIQSHNLLEMRPIIVNKNFEVIDGQHRLRAASILGLEIYYEVREDLKNSDIILMNVAKAWTMGDYLNYYCHQGCEEYLKLREFMEKKELSLIISLNLTMGKSPALYDQFRKGEYKYKEPCTDEAFIVCRDTIDYIKKMSNYFSYTKTNKFWRALLTLVNHPEFDASKWRYNYERMIERFGPRARIKDYVICMTDIYNWKNANKILINHEDLAA